MVEYSNILAAALAAQGYKDQVDSLHAKLSVAEAENERLEAIARNAADLLEQKGYYQTADAVRAAVNNIVATRSHR
jgi:hypothetical protein